MPHVAPPQLPFFADLSVRVAPAQEVGATPGGQRRVIPIVGGEVHGDGWTARVLPGGADFQLIVGPTLARLDARYVLETDGGDLIFVQNSAVRAASAVGTTILEHGIPVDPAQVYFRCVPSFETASRALGWINERMFVGSGVRRPDEVVISVYVLG